MFGWLDRIAAAIYQRGRGITEVSDRVAEEKRTALRTVRDSLREAMVEAEDNREHGRREAAPRSVAAANTASAVVREVTDEDARRLVLDWKGRFDAIPKGYKDADYGPKGYPEPAWSELRQAADAAQERLGILLRDLMEPKG